MRTRGRIGLKGNSANIRLNFCMATKKTRKQQETGPFSGDLAWVDALGHALQSATGDHRTKGVTRPLIELISTSKRGNVLEMTLRFQKGNMYCCGEPACFIHAYNTNWWVRFREALSEVSDRTPAPFRLHISCEVEPGAKFRANHLVGAPLVSQGYTCTDYFDERDARN